MFFQTYSFICCACAGHAIGLIVLCCDRKATPVLSPIRTNSIGNLRHYEFATMRASIINLAVMMFQASGND